MRSWNIPNSVTQVAQAQAPGIGRNPAAKVGAPLSLTAELTTITAGRSAVFPVRDLQPSFRTAYWIDEVRIVVNSLTDPSPLNTLPTALRLQFETGSYALSRQFLPLMMHSSVYGFNERTLGVRITPTTQRLFHTFRWVLPKPLYMPIGDVLSCGVQRDVSIGASQVLQALNITYVGRACAPGEAPPKVRHIPWLAFYKHPSTSTYSETGDEFRNPTLKPLMIQRLIARYTDGDGNLIGVDSGLGGLPSSTTRYVQAKIWDSLGYMIVPNMTPLGAIIDPMRASWTFNRALSAREQLSMSFQTAGSTSEFEAYVSMIASREEAV